VIPAAIGLDRQTLRSQDNSTNVDQRERTPLIKHRKRITPNHKRARFSKLARAVTGSTDISEVPARRVIDPYARKERIKDRDVAVSRTHCMDYEPELVSFVASRPQLQQRARIHDPRGGLTHHRRWT